jgi:hypothetical protein
MEASAIILVNSLDSLGAFQPSPISLMVHVTVALYGGSFSSVYLTQSAACYPFFVGGSRMLNLTVVKGLRTFPAFSSVGRPSQPVTVKVGFQHLLR